MSETRMLQPSKNLTGRSNLPKCVGRVHGARSQAGRHAARLLGDSRPARPRPACVRAETDWPVRSCPPSITLPLVALSCPEIRLK